MTGRGEIADANARVLDAASRFRDVRCDTRRRAVVARQSNIAPETYDRLTHAERSALRRFVGDQILGKE